MGGGQRILCALVLFAASTNPLPAQEARTSTFLFINQERILTDSLTGGKLLAEETAAQDALRADAREIDAAFAAEERRLTELRATLPVEEFRKKANDFDERVVAARQKQDARSAALSKDIDRKRRQFYAGVAPILVTLMERFGASAIFDETAVLLADDNLNITKAVIAEIDARAQQTVPVPPTPDAAPEAPATETPESGAPLPGKD